MIGVEGRVEVDEVNALAGEVVAEDEEVVAKEEGVLGEGVGHGGTAWAISSLGLSQSSGCLPVHVLQIR